ncbi:MAG: hypothetical protein ABI623_03190 [bacterium]
MSKIDTLLKRYHAHQKQLMKDLLKQRAEEQIHKQRLQRLFLPLQLQQAPEATMPPIRPPMQGLLNEQHAQVLKDMGTKHT